ncbi:uncharacterized protein LOC131672599 [Phymastichus coffea]|uniref:uncharacterized protein LOC131672599 n=1 Tax=Phymastichus coffea TaxID=108790 RepID=UPI00273AE077|nr:uncharacterized protein LOC131672599 [Phymastichus coffea]
MESRADDDDEDVFTCICLLAFIGLGSGTEMEKVMPSRFEIESSINRTIEEVEKMVRENPSLPNLSRNDIVNILYNITTNDMISAEHEALNAIQKTREDYQRALIVVLPYKPEDSGENLKELFTKPPLTKMVEDETRKDSQIQTAYDFFAKNNTQQSENLIENKHQLISAHMRFDHVKETTTTENINNQRFRPTSVTTEVPQRTKSESSPQKFTFNFDGMDQRAEASHTSVATKRPVYKGTFSRYRTSTQKPPKLEIITSITPKLTTTTEYVSQTTTTKKPANNILLSNQWRYNAPPKSRTTSTTMIPDDSPWKPMSAMNGYFVPTIENVEQADEPNSEVISVATFPRVTAAPTATTNRPISIFVTPSASTNKKLVNDNVEPVPDVFKLITVEPTTMRAEVMQLLKSIGLQPMKLTYPQNDAKINNHKDNFSDQFDTHLDSDNQPLKYETVKVNMPKPTTDNSFTAPSDVKAGVKNLSPDIQLLFQQFGLQSNRQPQVVMTSTTITTPRPTRPPSTNSYTHFKPLPTTPVKDLDFRNFLARFGLGLDDSRNQKAIQSKQITKRPSLIDMVPENMKKMLENIGLIRKTPKPETERSKRFEVQTQVPKLEEKMTAPIEHIFKPQETDMNNEEQNNKIKNLLHTVKMVQEGKAGVQDVQRVAHDLLQSTKTLANGPDPLKLEEILSNYRNSLKNEVKRQQEQTSTMRDNTAEVTEKSDDISLSSVVTTDSSGALLDFSESSASDDESTTAKGDQSSSSSMTDGKTEKPNFFDSFDITKYLNNGTASSTKAAPLSSGSTEKPNFFDTFNVNDYINNTEDSAKNIKPNIDDLEESFGGSTPEPDPMLPTRPKTGLYFLVDWNSFLEVGADEKDKVNLRFSPKVGDKTRFIPVKIP